MPNGLIPGLRATAFTVGTAVPGLHMGEHKTGTGVTIYFSITAVFSKNKSRAQKPLFVLSPSKAFFINAVSAD